LGGCDYQLYLNVHVFPITCGNMRTSKISPLRTFAILPLLALTVSASGCSWFSSGSGDSEEGALSESDLAAQREGHFGSGNIPTAEGEGMFRDVHFGYDSYAIEGEGRMDVESNAQKLQSQSNMKIVLEGHCDERGTVEYNMALGSQRARAVKSALIALGIASNRIETISYGEEIPLDAGHSDAAYAKNRRVHFAVGNAAPETSKGSKY
jgi:peptidoglycan-associated lipoprotein